jgi:hypothetical protein
VETVADAALDQALVRIGELSQRLWAVQAAHAPQPPRGLRRRPRCAGCHQQFPCPTAKVAAGAR